VTRVQAGWSKSHGLIAVRNKRIFTNPGVQIGSGAHPASYPVTAGASFIVPDCYYINKCEFWVASSDRTLISLCTKTFPQVISLKHEMMDINEVLQGEWNYALLLSDSEWIYAKEWVLDISNNNNSNFLLDCRWIWLEQNGVKFLVVTSQNQMLKCPL
jgi:hypothetical protein